MIPNDRIAEDCANNETNLCKLAEDFDKDVAIETAWKIRELCTMQQAEKFLFEANISDEEMKTHLAYFFMLVSRNQDMKRLGDLVQTWVAEFVSDEVRKTMEHKL